MRSSSGLMETDTVVTFPSGQSRYGKWWYYVWWAFEAGRRRGGRPALGGGWHFRGESANENLGLPVSTRSSRVPTRVRPRRASDRPAVAARMRPWMLDPGIASPLAARAGRCCSRCRPTTRPARCACRTRLRDAGFDADLVAAALTQSRLRARGAASSVSSPAGCSSPPTGSSRRPGWRSPRTHAQRFPPRACAHVHDLGCGIGADAMALAGLDLQVQRRRRRRGHGRDRRRQPAALARRRSPRRPGPRTCTCPPARAPATRRVARPGPPDARGGRRPAAGPGGSSASTRSRRRGRRSRPSPATVPATGAKLSARPSRTARCPPAPRRSGPRGRRGPRVRALVGPARPTRGPQRHGLRRGARHRASSPRPTPPGRRATAGVGWRTARGRGSTSRTGP